MDAPHEEGNIALSVRRALSVRPFSDENGPRSLKAQIRVLMGKGIKDEGRGDFKQAKIKIEKILEIWRIYKIKRSIS